MFRIFKMRRFRDIRIHRVLLAPDRSGTQTKGPHRGMAADGCRKLIFVYFVRVVTKRNDQREGEKV